MKFNHDLKDIYAWPYSMQIIFLAGISILLLFLFYLIDIRSMKTSLGQDKLQEKELKINFQQLVQEEMNIRNNIGMYDTVKNTFIAWNNRFADSKTLPALLDNIVSIGTKLQLKFNLFEPQQEVKIGQYYKIPVKVKTAGTFDGTAQFISQVVNMKQIAVIQNFNITLDLTKRDETRTMSLLKPETLVESELTIDIYRR